MALKLLIKGVNIKYLKYRKNCFFRYFAQIWDIGLQRVNFGILGSKKMSYDRKIFIFIYFDSLYHQFLYFVAPKSINLSQNDWFY